MTPTRTEHDTFGPIGVPASRLWARKEVSSPRAAAITSGHVTGEQFDASVVPAKMTHP
jgi:fumarate hydratase class II